MEHVDCVVVGAGVVGLAVARALAMSGREVLILERHGSIGSETSSRSSEVIHAGLYYPSGSLKARLCVEGRQRLYAYLDERGLPHRRCGKLLVATAAPQRAALATLQAQALANGVTDLQALDADAACAMEPALHCVAALWSPSTGIVDTHALMVSYLADAEAAGAVLALRCPVEHAERQPGGIVLHTGGEAPMSLHCRVLVNAAGLHAQALARRFAGLPPATVPPRFLAKGNYFTLSGRSPFSRLIYPMPDAAGLGVHLTLDLGGQARFGPDVEWVDSIDYTVDPRRGDGFYAAVRNYWPGLPDGALQPGYAGIRPKAVGPGDAAADFLIHGPAQHCVPGLVNLFAIESPGITASLALADEVVRLLR
jgi:L-2-hydroxyglutarate oxidase LhgO